MAAAYPVDVATNPNDRSQFYVLWGNGRIDAYGGLPAITDGPTWFHRIDQPVAVALHVGNWNTPSGQILDIQGGFHPFGGATNYMDLSGDFPINTSGITYVDHRRYCGWSWNPAGTGGYAIDVYGQLFEFGGEPDAPRPGPRFTTPAVKGFAMRWSPDKRAITLDASGALWADFGATFGSPPAPYFAGRDVARDLAVTSWQPARGYVLTGDGASHAWGGAPSSGVAGPYRAGADVARVLDVVSAENPTRLRQIHHGGQVFEYVASGAPTVIAGGDATVSPASTVTNTTRPVLSWAYSDPDRDAQAAWQLYVFTQAFVTSHSMTNPATWAADALIAQSGINPTTRGIASPVDLANGTYRMYVRVKDTAGQWSAWSNRQWTQNVAVPATPGSVTAVADDDSFTVALSVTTSSGADFVRFEASDDDGATWVPVRGADRLPRASTTTGVDRDAPQGITRTYRAVAFSEEPRTASVPSGTATAILPARAYLLTAVDDPALGGEVGVQEPAEWDRPTAAGIFQGLGARFATVLSDGAPKGRRTTLHIVCETRGEWERVEALAEADSTLVYRDPFGEVMYCRLVGDWRRVQAPAAALPSESTPLRHFHRTQLPLVEVRPPHLPVVDELA